MNVFISSSFFLSQHDAQSKDSIRDNPSMNWANNFHTGKQNFHQSRVGDHSSSARRLRELEDWQLKKLLQELYMDKKYMDKIINTKSKYKLFLGDVFARSLLRENICIILLFMPVFVDMRHLIILIKVTSLVQHVKPWRWVLQIYNPFYYFLCHLLC